MSEDESAACTGNGQFGKRGGFERAISREVSLLLQRANTKSNTNTNTVIDTNTKSDTNTNTIIDTNTNSNTNTNTIIDTNSKSNTNTNTSLDTNSKFNLIGKWKCGASQEQSVDTISH